MTLQSDIAAALKDAMRAKDKRATSSLRLLLTAMKRREKELRRPLEDKEIVKVIATQIKQRREAIEQYRLAERQDLAAVEEEELTILSRFMPEQLSEEELARELDEIIAHVGATGPKDMGKVMKAAMAKLAGRADGARVNALVKSKLTAK
ncbi:MAG: GatB/YqeY domain-containing protein [Deltaproteobacteria bacterium]|nr:GatB/YqeY domain-containing protein [Deltaproteobacteria bacterium]MBW2071125.1 GatB/YqeY domain-containing protein [Deltaproteobacteria bacterium]